MTGEQRFLAVYDEISEKLLKHFIYRVGNQELAQDLLQETFMKAWRTLQADSAEITNLRAFIYRIANNLIVDYYRGKHKEALELQENFDFASDFSIENLIDAKIAKSKLDSVLSNLPEETREILIFKYIDGLKVKEISQITGKSIMNVNVIAHRAMKLLKNKFNETHKS